MAIEGVEGFGKATLIHKAESLVEVKFEGVEKVDGVVKGRQLCFFNSGQMAIYVRQGRQLVGGTI